MKTFIHDSLMTSSHRPPCRMPNKPPESRMDRATRLAALYAKQGRSLIAIRRMLGMAFPLSQKGPI